MSHYHLYNISTQSATALIHLLSTLAFLAENFIFLYLGVSVVAYSGYFVWDWSFIAWNMVLCMVSRALNTFPLCTLANVGREKPIPFSYMTVIWFSGLRGAIAFSLALNVRATSAHHAGVMRSSTIFTVMFTTLIFGMGTSPMLRFLNLTGKGEEDALEDDKSREMTSTSSSNAEKASTYLPPTPVNTPDISTTEVGSVHYMWEQVDERYLKPVFGGIPRSTVGANDELSARLLEESER